jgi:putative ABC transport system permease protein
MATLLQDLRFAARTLLRNRGFTLIAVLTLALGIGANTAIFSVLSSILLKPLPYQAADRAVMLWSHWKGWDQTWLSGPEIVDYSRQTQIFSAVAPFDDGSFTLTGDGDAERIRAGLVGANLFSVLQVSPIMGRTFTAEEDLPMGPSLVVIGEDLWRRRFNADPKILGRAIQVDAQPFTVIGVMPRDFRLPLDYAAEERTQMWFPLQLGVQDENNRGSHGLYAVARLQPGVDLNQGQKLLDSFVTQMKVDHPGNYGPEFGVTMISVPDQILGKIRPALLLLLGAVGLVLLIACGNVANLLLARGEARQREIAIRTALGAGRGRLARQLLTESVLLSVVGGAVGVAFAWWGVAVLPAINPSSLPRAEAITIDLPVLTATLILSVMTGVVFGMVPAWQMLRDVHPELRENTRSVTTGRGGRRFRRILVGAEVMIAVILVTGAGLVMRSFLKLSSTAPGFEPHGVLTMRLSLPAATYPTRTSVRTLYTRLVDQLRGLPGVGTVGAVAGLPLATIRGDWGITVEGYIPPDPKLGTQADWQVVRPDYFEAMGIPLKKGRQLTDADGADAPQVIMVNEAMAKYFWPDRDPIGQRLHLNSSADSAWRTVVGVVGNIHHRGLDEAPRPEMYLPHAQFFSTAPDSVVPARSMTLTMRVRGSPEALTGPVRGVLHSLDPGLAVSDIRSLDDVVSRSIAAPRFTTALLSVFAALALILAAIGIYGVLSFIVAQRTAELGIRVALGASRSDVLRLVVGQGMRPVLIGLVTGLIVALAFAKVLQGFLFGVPHTDPGTYVTVTAVLMGAAVLACYLPARRAARVDPMTALRAE